MQALMEETLITTDGPSVQEKTAKAGRFRGERIVNPKTPERTEAKEVVKAQIERHRRAGGKIIYEIGFGGLFCVDLKSYDLSVGVDPMFSHKTSTGDLEAEMYAERLFFNQHISELPDNISPDVVVMVAPSPESIQDMLDELESKVNKETKFMFVIEHQSRNAVDGGSEEAIESVTNFLRSLGKDQWEADRDAADLELGLDDYFDQIGEDGRGGQLRTSPWQVEGRWKIVTAK